MGDIFLESFDSGAGGHFGDSPVSLCAVFVLSVSEFLEFFDLVVLGGPFNSLVGIHGGFGIGFRLTKGMDDGTVQELNVDRLGVDGTLSLSHFEFNV